MLVYARQVDTQKRLVCRTLSRVSCHHRRRLCGHFFSQWKRSVIASYRDEVHVAITELYSTTTRLRYVQESETQLTILNAHLHRLNEELNDCVDLRLAQLQGVLRIKHMRAKLRYMFVEWCNKTLAAKHANRLMYNAIRRLVVYRAPVKGSLIPLYVPYRSHPLYPLYPHPTPSYPYTCLFHT